MGREIVSSGRNHILVGRPSLQEQVGANKVIKSSMTLYLHSSVMPSDSENKKKPGGSAENEKAPDERQSPECSCTQLQQNIADSSESFSQKADQHREG